MDTSPPHNSNAAATPVLEKPLLMELRQEDKTQAGYFRPQAFLKITPALRTSGLLLALPPEEVKNFLCLLTFVTPNGECVATVPQLAQAMHLSVFKVRSRMQRLVSFVWRGEPLVMFLQRPSGLDAYTLNPKLLAYEHHQADAPDHAVHRNIPSDAREQIMAHSRAQYTRPRAEVERIVAEQLGHVPPDPSAEAEGLDPETAAIRRQMISVGVAAEQADALLGQFDLLRIKRQLRWLPYRQARNKAGFLIAAIEDNYEAPLSLRPHGMWRGQPEEKPEQAIAGLPATNVPDTDVPSNTGEPASPTNAQTPHTF